MMKRIRSNLSKCGRASQTRTRRVAGMAACLLLGACGLTEEELPACATEATSADLPLPSDVGREAYLSALTQFLTSFEYRDLGWCEDKGLVRDTGPYIAGVGYRGTHPPVHMAYSPQALTWLVEGRQAGAMPDGALIIKEQWYSAEVHGEMRSGMPAVAFESFSRNELDQMFQEGSSSGSAGWTTMIKDSSGSIDGWFWAEIDAGSDPSDPDGFSLLSDDFGSPCIRCHASAQVESTFIDERNIAGFPGEPHTYTIEDGWQTQESSPADPDAYQLTPQYERQPTAFVPWLPGATGSSDPQQSSEWLEQYPSIGAIAAADVRGFPPASFDHVPHPPAERAQPFVTADQCLGCHGGLSGFGDPMFEASTTAEGLGTDISPSGDWRFTPMGLAGRDPIFYSQLEVEVAMVAADYPEEEVAAFAQGAVETCMGCHGGPGVRQAKLDDVPFQQDFLYLDDPQDPGFEYGALARDGINCTMCHHIAGGGTEAEFFRDATTGRLPMSPPDVIYGPFDQDLHPEPMEHGVGFTPEHSPHVQSSRLCGHCHTINLPVIDDPTAPGTLPSAAFPIRFNDSSYPFPIHAEQATYTEWLNSDFQTEFDPGAAAQSCQSCHMQKTFLGREIDTIIASIQDEAYPAIDHLLPGLSLAPRTGYGRHQFVGLNVPLLQMFNQFYDVLGVNKQNYMSSLSTSLSNTIAQMLDQAAETTIELATTARVEGERVVADVSLSNLTGHRFPSGVAFRRAWIEVLLLDTQTEEVVWGSGRTNEVGVIVDGAGAPLPSEFFADDVWQPHFEEIASESQVQIYEEVPLDRAGTVTYSFLRRNDEPKDNRLLPRGWTARGPSDTISETIIESTHPKGAALQDPSYTDGSGSDRVTYRMPIPEGVAPADLAVRASIYYQSTSPGFLREKFTWAPEGEATRRLYYLLSSLDTRGTPIENWKLRLQTETVPVVP